jgi:hypothetical protein
MARGQIIHTVRPEPNRKKGRRTTKKQGPLACARCRVEAGHLVKRGSRNYCCAESACGRPEVWVRDLGNPECPGCGLDFSRVRTERKPVRRRKR